MSPITIELADSQLQKLQEIASLHGISPEDLLRVTIGDWLSSPKEQFSDVANYVLKKNSELYKRLA
jgi:antitoxin FitA